MINNIDAYNEAIDKLNYYTDKYNEGHPEITDEEWDNLYFDVKAYEEATGFVNPNSPTVTIAEVQTKLRKVTHSHPMLSLDKTKDINILKKWIGSNDCIVMEKMDGLTCSLTYTKGKLTSAETRGNGEIGEDILHNAMVIPSIPKTIDTTEDVVIVDGEVICTYKDFEQVGTEFKNPRNFASGSIRLLNPNECKKRNLTFVAWDLISSKDNFDKKLKTIKKYGFVTVPYQKVDMENFEEQQKSMREIAQKNSYPIDGLVYRVNDQAIFDSMGKTEHHLCGSYAFKFYDELFETELIDITWSVGKSGQITPVANFKPVEIEGTTVKNACLHNLSIMEEILGKPYVGQKIWVYKANLIIPQIAKAEKVN